MIDRSAANTERQKSDRKETPEGVVFKTLYYASGSTRSSGTTQYREAKSKEDRLRKATPPKIDIPQEMHTMDITSPSSAGSSDELDLINSQLNRVILRYFKSLLRRMTNYSKRTRRTKALKLLLRYSRRASTMPEYKDVREDSRVSLATVLRRSILIDIFNELDYNGELCTRFTKFLPDIMDLAFRYRPLCINIYKSTRTSADSCFFSKISTSKVTKWCIIKMKKK